jgi:FemAB-related protein (PEP-CTERM system-associated)
MSISVRNFRSDDAPAWDEFVRSHAHGTPFHLTAWRRFLLATYGYEPAYRLAESGGRLVGVLPLFQVSSFLTGSALISVPFAVYGGILAASGEARAALASAAAELGRERSVDYVELRNSHPDQSAGFSDVARYVTFRQSIDKSEEDLLAGIPRKTRRMVRKALKFDYETRPTRELDVFFDLYSANLRRLGTPCFPRSHFENLLAEFEHMIELREIHLDGKPVAAVLSFRFRDEIHPYYGASNPAFNAFAPNNYMYFDLMRWAAANGCKRFDFGRSKKVSGSHDFKAHWGMEAIDLPYEILLVNRKSLPNLSPSNPKFQLAIKVWRRIPLPVTRAVGPWFIKLLP